MSLLLLNICIYFRVLFIFAYLKETMRYIFFIEIKIYINTYINKYFYKIIQLFFNKELYIYLINK